MGTFSDLSSEVAGDVIHEPKRKYFEEEMMQLVEKVNKQE